MRDSDQSRIAIVAHSNQVARSLADILRPVCSTLATYSSVAEAIDGLASPGADLLVLDAAALSVPPQAVVAAIRSRFNIPVIALGDDDLDALVATLEAGADDYVKRSSDPAELRARVAAAVRRRHLSTSNAHESGHDVTPVLELSTGAVLDLRRGTVVRDAVEYRLTDLERRLLRELVRREGKVLTRRHLVRAVWGPTYEPSAPSLYAYVALLRRKIEPDLRRPRHIRTHHGIGYQFLP